MRKFFQLKNIIYVLSAIVIIAISLFLFLEKIYSWNFRTTNDAISSKVSINWTGLRDLKASGGTSVRFPYLRWKLSDVKGPIVLVDGIHEFHGYVYGIPSTFFGYQQKTPHWKYLIRRLVFTGTTAVRPELLATEP